MALTQDFTENDPGASETRLWFPSSGYARGGNTILCRVAVVVSQFIYHDLHSAAPEVAHVGLNAPKRSCLSW